MEETMTDARAADRAERESTLAQFEQTIEKPMQVLGFIWLGLLIIEFTRGRSALVAVLSTIIWIIFIIDFTIRLVLAPDKSDLVCCNRSSRVRFPRRGQAQAFLSCPHAGGRTLATGDTQRRGHGHEQCPEKA